MRLSIPEIFKKANDAATDEERKKILLVNQSPVLFEVLKVAFNPNLKMSLPEGEPPFKKDINLPIGYSQSNLYREARRFYIWLRETPNLSKIKKESLFIQLLEGIHWTEAEVVVAMKDKKLQEKYPNITYEFVFKSFPGLLPEPPKQEEVSPSPLVEELPKRTRGRKKKSETESTTD